MVWACHRLATRFLLLRQNLGVLGLWSRFAHLYLRRAANDSKLFLPSNWPSPTLFRPFDAETGELEEIHPEDWTHGLIKSNILTGGVLIYHTFHLAKAYNHCKTKLGTQGQDWSYYWRVLVEIEITIYE